MNNSNSCVICGDPVTDPVCVSCYIKQTRILLNDLKVNSIVSYFIINKLKNKFKLETLNDEECILCKKDTVTACYYCFSETLIRILKELNFTENIIENFKYNHMCKEIYLENENLCLYPSM
jgi:hypothetical protein